MNIQPSYRPPPLACDAHCHVFGPATAFPYAPKRKYTPKDAPKNALFDLHHQLGFERAVIVQASCHGTDNRAMLDMLRHAHGRYRGVAVIDEHCTQKELQKLHDAGVRGIRFNFLSRLMDVKPPKHYLRIAEKITALGWHIVVYFESENLHSITDIINKFPCPVVIDHMGRPDISKPINDESFQRVCELLSNKGNWIKVSCIERLSKVGPPYSDAIPFAHHLITHYPNQVLWGTDWPHPNMEGKIPDDTLLMNSIPLMVQDKALQKRLLVDNPHTLYGFEDD